MIRAAAATPSADAASTAAIGRGLHVRLVFVRKPSQILIPLAL
jgi:hypothetical protein